MCMKNVFSDSSRWQGIRTGPLGELDIKLHLCPNISTSFVNGERNMPWSEEVSSVSHASVYLGIPHDCLVLQEREFSPAEGASRVVV